MKWLIMPDITRTDQGPCPEQGHIYWGSDDKQNVYGS